MKSIRNLLIIATSILLLASTRADAQITDTTPATTGAIKVQNFSTNVLDLWIYRIQGTNYAYEAKQFAPGTITLLYNPNFNFVEASDWVNAMTAGYSEIPNGQLVTFTMYHKPAYDTNESPAQLISVNDFKVVVTTDLNSGL